MGRRAISTETSITAIIKTFERPEKLRTLLASIRQFYPTLPVVVVDDSQEPLTYIADAHTTYIHTEYDIGVSEGRNRAVAQVKTPYTLLLDDDYVMTRQTRLETFLNILQTTPFRLVAGEVHDFGKKRLAFCGTFQKQDDVLSLHQHAHHGVLNGYPVYDFVIQFFLAETSLLQTIGWNPSLKTLDHEEFFWRLHQAGVQVTATPRVSINHFPDYKQHANNAAFYKKRRERIAHFTQIAFSLMGVKEFRHMGSPYRGLSWFTSTLRLYARNPRNNGLMGRLIRYAIRLKRKMVGGYEL
jgi:GT2 family glycosyltransferase